MGVEHTARPIWGVQFHPESIATEHGRAIAENFYALAGRMRSSRARPAGRATRPPAPPSARTPQRADGGEAAMRLRLRELEGEAPTEHALRTALRRGRERLLARQRRRADPARAVLLPRHQRRRATAACSNTTSRPARSRSSATARDTVEHKSIFDLLDREAGAARGRAAAGARRAAWSAASSATSATSCKADCGSPNVHSSDMPDALLMLANRVVAVDHVRRRTYVCAVGREDDAEADAWLDDGGRGRRARRSPTRRRRRRRREPRGARRPRQLPLRPRPRALPRRHRPLSQAELAAGESYEVCLTDQFSTDASPDPFDALPPPAPQQPGAVRRLPQASASARSSAPRRSASSRSTATAGSRRGRSRGRSRASRTRPRTPPAAPS